MKKITVLTGSYGSGKTEIAVNMALACARSGRTMLLDLDIVNPYFRSSDQIRLLEAEGVRVIAPNFAGTTVDVPSLPASVAGAFSGNDEYVIFDIGGDPVGATVLGAYHEPLAAASGLETLYVVNVRRPMTGTAEQVEAILIETQKRARIRVTGLINNANLGRETAPEDLQAGYALMEPLSKKLGVPVRYTAGAAPHLAALYARKDLKPAYLGEPLAITPVMRPAWMDIP